MGKAYAVFDCKASKEAIESEIILMRRIIGTPGDLEVFVIDLSQLKITDKEKLAEAHMKYMLQAIHPRAGNKETAGEVTAILNQTYQSPLY